MKDPKKENAITAIMDAIGDSITKDNIQTYLLGTKKNGTPRALYDIIKDYTSDTKKKKKKRRKKAKEMEKLALYVSPTKKKKGKGKKKKKKDKHWKY